MYNYKAIIWDCDGVLIDSEILACETSAHILREHGYSISTDDYLDRYAGKGFHRVVEIVREETGLEMNISPEEKNGIQKQVFIDKLKATSDVRIPLETIKLPQCIASGSSMERLVFSLGIVGLDRYFSGRIFSSELVKKDKPAPDIFLYAAEKLNVKPADCLVIEDGYNGAKGALAAGMTVFGYAGASHMNETRIQKLKEVGVLRVFRDMGELPELVREKNVA